MSFPFHGLLNTTTSTSFHGIWHLCKRVHIYSLKPIKKKKVFKITIPKVFMIITTLGFLGLPCAPVGLQNSQLLTSCKTVLFLKLLEAMHGQHPLFSFKKVQLLFYLFIFTKLIHPIDTINHSYI